MSFKIDLTFDAIEIRLSGWDAIRLVRQRLAMPYQLVTEVAVVDRQAAEFGVIEADALTAGANYGRRVGVAGPTGTGGRQFWAVGASDGAARVVVVETRHDRFTRLVLEPASIDPFVETLRAQIAR